MSARSISQRILTAVCGLAVAALAGLFVLALPGGKAVAATETWSGGNVFWNTSSDWTGTNLPPLSGDSLVFGAAGAGGLYLNNNLTSSAFNIAGITFNAGAGAYIIGDGSSNANAGNAFALTGNLTNNSTSLQTINNPFSMTAVRTFTTTAGGGDITLGGNISGAAGGIIKAGLGTVTLAGSNSYTGTTTVNLGMLILTGTNTGTGEYIVSPLNAGDVAVLSLRNSNAFNATTGSILLNSVAGSPASILEIGAKFGNDPNADFAMATATTPGAPTAGQIGFFPSVNAFGSAGFAAWGPFGNSGGTANNRIVALGGSANPTGLVEKTDFGGGGGDHFTFGSPTANGTLILKNSFNLNGSPYRQWQSIRGVGIVPEGELDGLQSDAGNTPNVSFSGNGGIIFTNTGSTVAAATYDIIGGAVYLGASDTVSANGPLGNSASGINLGTNAYDNGGAGAPAGGFTTGSQNVGFITYGPGAGVGPSATITSNRAITVVNIGTGTMAIGGATADHTAFTGTVTLNKATTFVAKTGGQVDFTGVVSGAGPLTIGAATLEGDANTPGIPDGGGSVVLTNTGNNYSGTTTIAGGTLLLKGAGIVTSTGSVTVGAAGILAVTNSAAKLGAGATLTVQSTGLLGGGGTLNLNGVSASIAGTVTPSLLASGGTSSLGIIGNMTLQPNSTLNFNFGATSVNDNISITGIATLSSGTDTLNIGVLSGLGLGAYTFLNAGTLNDSASWTITGNPNPLLWNTAVVPSGNSLQLQITAIGTTVTWTGGATSHWNTADANWSPSNYADNMDPVVFDNTGSGSLGGTAIVIDGTVHPTSVTFNNGPTVNYSFTGGTIAGLGSVTVQGGGLVTFSNTNTYTGATQVTNGTLTIDVPGLLTASAVTAGSAGVVNVNGAIQNPYVAVASGGSLNVGSGGSIASATTLANSGATTFNNAAQTIASLNGGSTGLVVLNGTALSLTGGTFAGGIQGSGSLALVNSGTLVLSGANTWSNGTTINAGSALQAASLPAAGSILNNGQLALTNAGPLTVSTPMTGSGQLLQTGAGATVLSTSNNYSGGTNVSAGTLTATMDASLGTGPLSMGAAATVNFTSATPTVYGLSGAGSVVLGNSPLGSTNLTVNAASNSTFSGVISEAAAGLGSLTKAGSGSLALGAAATYSGPTTIVGGTLKLASGGAISLTDTGTLWGTTVQANTNNFTISPNANVLVVELDWRNVNAAPTVTYNGVAMTSAVTQLGTAATFINSAIFILPRTSSGFVTGQSLPLAVNFNGAITDAAIDAFSLGGVNLAQLPGSSLPSSTVATDNEAGVSSLSLSLSGISTPGSWAAYTTDYRLGTNALLNATLTAGTAGTLITSGNGGSPANGNFWDVSNANCIDAGALIPNITSSSVTLTETAGGVAGPHWTMAGAVFVPSNGNTLPPATTVQLGAAAGTPTLDLNGSSQQVAGLSDYGGFTNGLVTNNSAIPATLTLSATGGSTTFSGTIQNGSGAPPGSGTTALVINGSGTQVLAGSNAYSGGTTVTAGTLTAVVNAALGNGPLSVAAVGQVNLLSAAPTVYGLAGAGNVVLGNPSVGPANLTVNSLSSSTFSGVISEAGSLAVSNSLTKTGPGSLTLSGINTYGGGTTISQGFLAGGVLSLGPGAITLAGGTFHPVGAAPGLAVSFYKPDAGTTNSASYAALQAWLAGETAVYATSSTADGNTQFNFNGPNGNGGQAFNGTNGPGNIGYTDSAGGNNYTAVFTGFIYLNANQTYTFATRSDDGSMLFINGQTVVNNNVYQGMTTVSGSVSEATSGYYPLEVEYYQGGGGAGLEVYSDAGNTVLQNGQVSQGIPVNNNLFSNNVVVTANSTLDLPGYVPFGFGTLSIGGNTLHVTSGPGTANFTGTTFSGAPTFDVQGANVLNLGTISGAYGFNTTGSGTLIVSGTNNTGAVTVNGGSLLAVEQTAAAGPLGSASLILNNGTLVLANTSTAGSTFDAITNNPLALAGSNDSIIAGSLLAGVANGSVTLGGTGTLPVAAGQTLNLGATNGYTLAIGAALQFANSGTISAGPGSVTLYAANLNGSGGTLSASAGGTLVLPNNMAGVDAVYAPASGGTVQFTGDYQDLVANLQPAVGGTLLFSSSTSMSGTLNVAGGAFVAGNTNSFGTLTLQINGGTLGASTALTGTNAVSNPLIWGANAPPTLNFGGTAMLQLSSSLVLTASGTAYNLNDPNVHGTLSGAISGPGLLNITGYPTLSNTNTYTGGTTFNPATNATINNNQAFGSGLLTFNNGGFSASTVLTGSNAIANPWTIPAGSAAYFSGVNGTANSFELSGSGSLPAGNETIHIPNYYFANQNNNTNQGLKVILSGLISGPGALSRGNDANTNNNTLNGTVVINNPLNNFSGGFTLNSDGGNIDVQGASTTLSNGTVSSGPLGTGSITIGDTNYGDSLGLLNSSTAAATLANPVTVYDNAAYWSVSGLTLSGSMTLAGRGQNIGTVGTVQNVYNGVTNFYLGTNYNGNNAPFSNSSVTFSGVISGGTTNTGGLLYPNGINLRSGSGAGGLTLSGVNTYTGPTSITYGTLIAGGNAPSGSPGVFGNATSAITIGDGNSGGNPAALVTNGAYEIDRPITINATAGPTTLGTVAGGTSTYTGVITQNNATSLTLTSPAGGAVLFSGSITGSGGVTIAAASNIVFSGSNFNGGATNVNGGTLTLSNGTIGGGTVAVAAGGTLAGAGAVNVPTVVNGVLSPSLGSPLIIANTLTLNDGSSFAMLAGGGTVGLAQVSTLSYASSAGLTLVPLPQDLTTLNGTSNYTFLTWTAAGPAPGIQANWNVAQPNVVSWTGAIDQSTWSTVGNWNGVNVSGGTILAVDDGGTNGHLEVDGLSVTSASGPTATSNVFIQSSSGANVMGPAGAASVLSLTLGSPSGATNMLNLGSGPLSVTGTAGTTVNATGVLNVGGGTLQTTGLNLSGSASLTTGGSLGVTNTATVNAAALLAIGAGAAQVGTLNLSGTASLGAGGSLGVTNTATVNAAALLAIGAGAAQAGTLNLSGTASLAAGGSLTVASAATVNAAALLAVGSGSVQVGTLNLAANSSLTMNGGNLTLTAPTTIAAGPAFVLGPAGGTINIPFTAAGLIDGATETGMVRLLGQITGSGGLTVNGGSGSNMGPGYNASAPYLLILNSSNLNNYTGNTTINNATVTNDSNIPLGVNLLPATTVLTLTNSAVFALWQGNAAQTLAGLAGDSTTAIGTENNSSPSSLTINPAVGMTYTYAGMIGDVEVLGRGRNPGTALTLTIGGQGTQVLTGSDLFTGIASNLVISSGTLQMGNGGATGSLAPNAPIMDNGALVFDRGNTVTQGTDFSNAPVNGTGSLVQAGSGLLVLNVVNGYSGGTTVSNGTLQLGNISALGTGGLTANAGVVDLAGNSPTIAGLSGAAGTITNSATNAQLLTIAQSGSSTFSGSIQNGVGGVNLTVSGGTQVLAGVNSSYTGPTTVSGGVLAVTSLAIGGSPSSIGASPNAYQFLVIDNGTLQYVGTGSTTDRQFTVGPSGMATIDASGSGPLVFSNTNAGVATVYSGSNTLTLTGSNTGANTFGLVINDGGINTSLVKNGPGTWVLNGQSVYSGNTTVQQGTLVLSAAALPPGGAVLDETAITVASGATLAIQPAGTTMITGTSSGTGIGATLTLQHGSTFDMTPDGTIGSFTLQNEVSSGVGLTLYGATLKFNLGAAGADELIASGYSAACPSGTNMISISGVGNSLLPTGTTYYPLIVATGGTLTGDFALSSSTVSVDGSTYDLALHNSGGTESISATLANAATFSGSGVWVSNSGSNWSTPASNWLDNSGNGVQAAPGVPPRPANTDTAIFSGSGSVTAINLDVPGISLASVNFSNKNYSLTGSTLTMNGSSSGTATMTVSSGTQEIDSAVEIAGGNLAISLTNTGRLALTNNISDDVAASGTPRSLTLTSADGTGTLVLSGSNTYGGGTDVASGTLIAMNSASIPSGTSLIVGSGGAFTFAPATTLAPAASNVASASLTVEPVPEPGTIALLLAAVGAWCGRRIVRRRSRQS